jgi:hypothetical protein
MIEALLLFLAVSATSAALGWWLSIATRHLIGG